MNEWNILAVMATHERDVIRRLRRHEVEAYAPMRRVWRLPNAYRRAKRLKEYPALPGYVFALLSDPRAIMAALGTEDVFGFVGFNGEPCRLPAKEVDNLRLREERGEFDAPGIHRRMKTHREFDVGDRVTASLPTLSEVVFRCVGIDGDKARLQLDGGLYEIVASIDAVEKAA